MKKAICAALLAVLAAVSALTVSAKTDFAHDYIYNTETDQPSVIPKTHEAVRYIRYIEGYAPGGDSAGMLNNPQDIFVDRQDNIYIADTDNNAVVKLDPEGNYVMAITQESGGIQYPLGVFVNDTQDIFVADNGNARVVHFDADGNYVEEFVAPDSELLSQNLTAFDPTKLAINDYNGYIYLLIGKEFLTLDAKNQFKGLIGTEPVGFDLADYLVRMFATDLQKEKLKKREPVSYNNFCITFDNKIYAVSMAGQNQIRKINSSGDSLFPAGRYGRESRDPDTGEWVAPMLTDIAVNSHEMITVADARTSLLYQYDVGGELLAVFGGKGDTAGRFGSISSICYNTKDELLVLDAGSNSVQILRTTAFADAVHRGITLYRQGEYDRSLETFDSIAGMVSCYPAAQKSMANIYYKQKQYDRAMAEYREAGDREGYAAAFAAVRKDWLTDNFAWVTLAALAAAAAAVALTVYARRYCVIIEEDMFRRDIGRVRELTGMSQLALFHPLNTWDLLKWRRMRKNWLPAVVLPLLTVLVRFLASSCTAYAVSTMESYEVSFWYELLIVAVPYVTFGLALYKISSVFSGEMTLCETFGALGYSLVPMIVIWPLLTALSHAAAAGEIGLFRGVQTVVCIWVALNILSAVQRINDCTLAKAVGLTLLGVLGTLIVWALLVLIYIFTAQLGFFGGDLWAEIVSRLYSV